ncbi:hypothetical protein RCS94_04000 [Orbaceae bacterium ac157xtp]
MRSIRKSHVPTVSFRFERQIAEEGSRAATRATAPRRGLRVVALDNPYRSGDADHEKNTIIKQTETTTLPSILYVNKNPNKQLHTTDYKGITFIYPLFPKQKTPALTGV